MFYVKRESEENNMMRKIKKVLGTVLLSAMVFSVAGNASVLANNWENKSFSFTFNNAQTYTPVEKKRGYKQTVYEVQKHCKK